MSSRQASEPQASPTGRSGLADRRPHPRAASTSIPEREPRRDAGGGPAAARRHGARNLERGDHQPYGPHRRRPDDRPFRDRLRWPLRRSAPRSPARRNHRRRAGEPPARAGSTRCWPCRCRRHDRRHAGPASSWRRRHDHRRQLLRRARWRRDRRDRGPGQRNRRHDPDRAPRWPPPRAAARSRSPAASRRTPAVPSLPISGSRRARRACSTPASRGSSPTRMSL